MSKFALKFLLTASALRRSGRRIDRVWAVALLSTLVTVALMALYLWQRSNGPS